MEAWIQKHDFSTELIADASVAGCVELLSTFDWGKELNAYESALEENRDRCPPAMGLVERDRTLQVMPMRDGRSHYSYSCDHPLRIFAFFGATKTMNAWEVSDEHRERLIGFHFAGEEEQLVRALHELSARPDES